MLKNSLKGIGVLFILMSIFFYVYSYKENGGCTLEFEDSKTEIHDCSEDARVIFVSRHLTNSILSFVGGTALFTIGLLIDNKKSFLDLLKK